MSENEKPFCFVISPIDDPGTATRELADGVLDEIIRPALEEDFQVDRADHDQTPGMITQQIIEKLVTADLVVADLSEHNPNVMYELAIRHAKGDPFVHIAREGTDPPFDISDVQVLYYNPGLKGRTATVEKLREAANKAMEQGSTGNPISTSMTFMELARSGSPDDQAMVKLIQELQHEVRALRRDRPKRIQAEPTDRGRSTIVRATKSGEETISFDEITLHPPPSEPKSGSAPTICALCNVGLPEYEAYKLTRSAEDGSQESIYLCNDCAHFGQTEPVRTWIKADRELHGSGYA